MEYQVLYTKYLSWEFGRSSTIDTLSAVSDEAMTAE